MSDLPNSSLRFQKKRMLAKYSTEKRLGLNFSCCISIAAAAQHIHCVLTNVKR